MDQYLMDGDAWQRAVGQLDTGYSDKLTARFKQLVDSQIPRRLSKRNDGVAITVLERSSSQTATVSWSDPQGCKYGEQVWRFAIAKRQGKCALSGQMIAAGDAIYRPAKVKPPPVNAAAMMLAVVVDRAFVDQRC